MAKCLKKIKLKMTHVVPAEIINDDIGFSIIEILIAIVIFSIGVLAAASMMSYSMGSNSNSNMLSSTTEKAVGVLEELSLQSYIHPNLIAGTTTPAQESDGIDNNNNGIIDEANETGSYSVQWTVIDDALVADTKTISVTVNSAISGKQSTLVTVIPLIR